MILARRLAQDKRASAAAVDSIGSENAAYGERTNAAPHGDAFSSARRRNPRKTGQRPTSASASPDQVCLTLKSRRWPNAQAHIRWAPIAGAPLLELFKHVQFWPAAPMAKSDRHSTDLHLARNCASGPWIFVPDTCGTKTGEYAYEIAAILVPRFLLAATISIYQLRGWAGV